jgi:hypothetical protein
MSIAVYDLFSGSIDEGPVWLAAFRDSEAARDRMLHLAEHTPGAYFIFDHTTQKVLDSIDTKSKAAEGATN